MDIIANKANMLIDRGKDEKKVIKKTNDIEGLIQIMKSWPDTLNHALLKKKILKLKDSAIPLILEELKLPQRSDFHELAVHILHRAKIDCSEKIIDVIKNHQKSAYAVSLLCMLLGFYDHEETNKLLWDYFHYFKEKFNDETYSDGPLIGLLEIRARRLEKLSKK